MRRRALAFAGLVAVLLPVGTALGDADPASDMLIGSSVFYPFSTPVSSGLQKTLNAEVGAAGRAHFPLKVAIVDARIDLGGIPALFGKPQQYAKFLDQELAFNGKPPLLVVMPTGYGVAGLAPAVSAVAGSMTKPAGGHSDDLAKAVIAAVPKLAAASGHPIAAAAVPASGGGSGTGPGVAIGVVAAAAVASAGLVVTLRRRKARPR
jgi:hypothetical protein